MPKYYRNRSRQVCFSFLFLCLLAWNTGAAPFPDSATQTSQASTHSFTPIYVTPSPEVSQAETPAPTGTASGVAPGTEGIPSAAPTQTQETSTPGSNPASLPAVFAAGAYAQEELVVRFKPGTKESRVDECFQGIRIQIQMQIEELQTFVLKTVPADLGNNFYHIIHCAGVLYVEPNFLLQAADTVPNDPDFGLQYGLVNIRAPQGWDLATGSPAVTIAILDTGVDPGHAELAVKLVAGHDFVNNDSDPQDDNGHGTHVAGIAGAASSNGTGIAGVSWGARIMPVKVLNASGGGSYANVAAGVVWAVDHGAQVLNLSLGGSGESAVLGDAIDYARGKGAVIVAAAGNAGAHSVLYPARYPGVIAVARTDSANHWSNSNYGPEIDLSAPGISIYATVPGGYDYKSGTSMAAGFVSGLAAILMGIPGNASADGVESQMESTALDVEFPGWDEYTGAGLIQMDAAIALALGSVPPTAGPAASPVANGGSGPFGAGITNTPIPLLNTPATLETQTATQTATAMPTSEPIGTIDTLTETAPATPPPGSANEVQAQRETGRSNILLPCAGLALIGLGLLLLLAFRKK